MWVSRPRLTGVVVTFQLRKKVLAAFSRQMSVMLEAGLSVRHALATVERGARASLRQLYYRLGTGVQNGRTLSEAIEAEGRAFPPLFQRLVQVGETVGGLDNVLKRLSDYYDLLRVVYRRLIVSLIWPVFEYWGLVVVLTIVAYVVALFGDGGDPERAALRVFATGVLVFCTPIALYFVVTRLLGGSRVFHEILLRVPVIGTLMRTMAIARFSWVMEMMTAGGIRILDAIRWSFESTTNSAFEARAPGVVEQVRGGVPLNEALRQTGLFPHEYAEMIHVAEESGTMPDMFARLARNYFEEMDRRIKALGVVMFWVIWIIVAAVIIGYIIYFASMYARIIGDLM